MALQRLGCAYTPYFIAEGTQGHAFLKWKHQILSFGQTSCCAVVLLVQSLSLPVTSVWPQGFWLCLVARTMLFAFHRGWRRAWGIWVKCACASVSPAPSIWSTPAPCRVSTETFRHIQLTPAGYGSLNLWLLSPVFTCWLAGSRSFKLGMDTIFNSQEFFYIYK